MLFRSPDVDRGKRSSERSLTSQTPRRLVGVVLRDHQPIQSSESSALTGSRLGQASDRQLTQRGRRAEAHPREPSQGRTSTGGNRLPSGPHTSARMSRDGVRSPPLGGGLRDGSGHLPPRRCSWECSELDGMSRRGEKPMDGEDDAKLETARRRYGLAGGATPRSRTTARYGAPR